MYNLIHLFKSFFFKIGQTSISASNDSHKIQVFFDESLNNLINKCLEFVIKGSFISFLDVDPSISEKQFLSFKDDYYNKLIDYTDEFQTYYISNIESKLSKLFDLLLYFVKYIRDLSEVTFHITYRNFNFYNIDYKELREICEYINLTILEILLNDNYSYIENLIRLEERKKRFHSEFPFQKLNIFEAKFVFIRYKWSKRQKYNKKIQSEYYGKNFSEKYIFSNGYVIDLNNKVRIGEEYYSLFRTWIDKIEFHYFTEEFVGNGDFGIKINDEINTKSPNSYELFYKIKYNKDIFPNEEFFQVTDKLIYKDQTKSHSTSFFTKNYLYFKNNQFSLLIDKSTSYTKEDEEMIDREFQAISSLTKNHSNNNFFVTYKYLKYKTNKLNHLLETEISKTLNEFTALSLKIQNLITECNTKFKWSLSSYNMLYQHEYKNSIILIDNSEVYFPTSFLLPFSSVEYQLEINKIEQRYNLLVKKYQERLVQNSIESFKDELKQSEKKFIETITIFTAIISFIVGGIGAFKFLETFIQAIIFILIYSISISIFVMLIFVSTKGKTLLNQYKNQIIFIYVFVLFLIGCLFFSYHNVITGIGFTPQQEKIIKNRLDSILNNEIKLKKSSPFKNSDF